ncbi:hypothetical protein HGG76_14500 [Ochrobactrum tritici]|uniref:Reverse transcriptase domain-containing protein n=1 Tax=Brucella tritici TaxID=94626 RepID=A0A7X6JC39_9HYPH|nr:hypothetical protein [Brucella tritici]
MNEHVDALGGIYHRYSDDIIVVLPAENVDSFEDMKIFLQDRIRKYGAKIQIQDKKCALGSLTISVQLLTTAIYLVMRPKWIGVPWV